MPVAEPMEVRAAIRDLAGSRIAEISALGMGDPAVIPLWYGEGDLPTPDFIGAAATAALEAGHTFYTYKAGLPELRGAIAGYLTGLHARPTGAERIVVSSSGMTALMLVTQALIDPGDNLVIIAPVWPNIAAAVSIMGGAARRVALDPVPGGGWRLDVERLFAACDARTRGIFVNSPSNPTGWMISATEIAALMEFARRRGLWLIADEVYSRIVYGNRPAPSFLDHAWPEDRLIVVNSFSKNWAMTGWRLGWMVVPPDLARSVECLAQNFYISPPALSQLAALPVFGCRAELDGHVQRYRANRDRLIATLTKAGLDRFAPAEGAFYLYVDVSALTGDSEAFCRRMLAETGVATTPGRDFDPVHGDSWLRLSFAGSTEDIAEAARRLALWLPRAG